MPSDGVLTHTSGTVGIIDTTYDKIYPALFIGLFLRVEIVPYCFVR
jgi:hypothetical protein